MLPRTSLIQIQRSMYDKLKEHASSMFGRLPSELKLYFREYQRDLKKFSGLSTKRELLLEVLKAQVILLGDYHTLSQAQRTVIRLMRDSIRVLNRKKRKVILALEMLTPEHDATIKKFLSGSIKEREFLKRIGFQENWGFPWENYRALFEFAKEHKIEIRGINPPTQTHRKSNLKKRDRFSAQVIAELTLHDPNAVVFVLIGDLHLASPHLPLELKELLKRKSVKRQTLIIHQNLEKIYWQLVEQGLESFVDVVRIRKDTFCVMNTPPWVKLKSHLNWAELVAETGTIAPLDSVAQAFDEMDYSHEVQDLTQLIAKFLGMTLPKLENFQIYGPLDLDLLQKNKVKLDVRETLRSELNFKYAQVFKSHFIPGPNILFLNSLSLNHVAAQSSIYLYSFLSGFQDVFENPLRDFYKFVWVEALGFLGAKIINPKRKCNGRTDLKKHLTVFKNRGTEESLSSIRFALEHLTWEREHSQLQCRTLFMFPKSSDKNLVYYKAAKILGHLLGYGLYHSIVEMRLSPSEVRSLFYRNFRSSDEARQLYLEWGQKLDIFGYRESIKWEKL